jgi:zinc protease
LFVEITLSGIAHFLEHMIFKGSVRQPLGEFEAAIEACGGNTNACTSNDYTNYHITIPPSDFAQLAPRLLDLVLNAAIPELEFDRERQVVLEEIARSKDNCDRRIYRELSQLIYSDLPYSRAVLGSEEVISGLSSCQMQKFHRALYQPQNMTIVAVGGLPVEEMQRVIEGFWANNSFANLSSLEAISQPAPDRSKTLARQEIIDSHLKRARLICSWRTPGLADYEANLTLGVLASVLGGGRTSRLVKDLKETRGICDGSVPILQRG